MHTCTHAHMHRFHSPHTVVRPSRPCTFPARTWCTCLQTTKLCPGTLHCTCKLTREPTQKVSAVERPVVARGAAALWDTYPKCRLRQQVHRGRCRRWQGMACKSRCLGTGASRCAHDARAVCARRGRVCGRRRPRARQVQRQGHARLSRRGTRGARTTWRTPATARRGRAAPARTPRACAAASRGTTQLPAGVSEEQTRVRGSQKCVLGLEWYKLSTCSPPSGTNGST